MKEIKSRMNLRVLVKFTGRGEMKKMKLKKKANCECCVILCFI